MPKTKCRRFAPRAIARRRGLSTVQSCIALTVAALGATTFPLLGDRLSRAIAGEVRSERQPEPLVGGSSHAAFSVAADLADIARLAKQVSHGVDEPASLATDGRRFYRDVPRQISTSSSVNGRRQIWRNAVRRLQGTEPGDLDTQIFPGGGLGNRGLTIVVRSALRDVREAIGEEAFQAFDPIRQIDDKARTPEQSALEFVGSVAKGKRVPALLEPVRSSLRAETVERLEALADILGDGITEARWQELFGPEARRATGAVDPSEPRRVLNRFLGRGEFTFDGSLYQLVTAARPERTRFVFDQGRLAFSGADDDLASELARISEPLVQLARDQRATNVDKSVLVERTAELNQRLLAAVVARNSDEAESLLDQFGDIFKAIDASSTELLRETVREVAEKVQRTDSPLPRVREVDLDGDFLARAYLEKAQGLPPEFEAFANFVARNLPKPGNSFKASDVEKVVETALQGAALGRVKEVDTLARFLTAVSDDIAAEVLGEDLRWFARRFAKGRADD